MHEMSIATNLLQMAEEEAHKRNCQRLTRICVEYGVLTGIMPEALEFCFSAITRGTPHEKAQLELIPLPLELQCPFCKAIFEAHDKQAMWEPCPQCGETFGHAVLRGRELLLARIEAMPDQPDKKG